MNYVSIFDPRALYWYEEIQDYDECAAEEGAEPEWGMSDPPYVILARQAEIRLMDDIQAMSKVSLRNERIGGFFCK